jgi:hypothetical protein
LLFEPESLIEAFLTALDDAEAGSRLHQLHADDALVRSSEGLKQACEIPPGDFAAAHREINLQFREALPQYAKPALVRITEDPGAREAVCWFELSEARQQQRVFAALGLRTAEGQPRIGWATLTPQVKEWSYRDGYLHSIADYPWMRVSEPARARALIDASYFRQYWRSPTKFSSLPDARFICQMSTVCCKHDFEIALPAEAQLLIDAMPWKTLRPELEGTQLSARADGKLQLKELNETCRFLGVHGLCLIHQTLGRQPFGPCCVFPVSFAQTPEGVAVALSPICDGARHGAGPPLLEREADLRERLVHAEPRRPDGFRLAAGLQIPWENFRDVEKALCDILGAEELPMRTRLYLGSRLLRSLRDHEDVHIDQWLTEPQEVITPELRQAIHEMLGRILDWDRTLLRSLPKTIPDALFTKEVREPQAVARLLQNTLFCKTYSYQYDLTTAHNFLIVLYLLALLMQESVPHPMTDRMWRELGSLGVHGLLKSLLHEGVPAGFRNVFGTAEFGVWMLSA